MAESHIAIFRGKEIRKTIYKNEWWFVIADVVSTLTDTPNVKDYLTKMRKRDEELSKGWGQFVIPLEIGTKGGPQKLNCANTEGVFRIIQSIPSPKAEPVVGRKCYKRLQEVTRGYLREWTVNSEQWTDRKAIVDIEMSRRQE